MAQALLNWTPVNDANSTQQQVQYRLKGSGTWTTFSTVPAANNTETVTGLLDNEVYEFQVVNVCSSGGPTPSTTVEAVKLTCVTLSTSNITHESVDYSFAQLGGDITSYDVQLLNGLADTVLQTQNKVPAATVTGTFTGLIPSSGYNLRVVPKIGTTYSKTDCAIVGFTTAAPPECNVPTGVTATMS